MLQKGILKSFDSATHTATVRLDGSVAVYLAAVPVSRGIPAAEMTAGRTVAVVDLTPGEPVVIGVF